MCLFSTLFDTFLVSNVLAWVPSGKQNWRKRSCLKRFILTNDPRQWRSADTNTEMEVELVTTVGNWGLVPLGLPMKLFKCISELFTWRLKGEDSSIFTHPQPVEGKPVGCYLSSILSCHETCEFPAGPQILHALEWDPCWNANRVDHAGMGCRRGGAGSNMLGSNGVRFRALLPGFPRLSGVGC